MMKYRGVLKNKKGVSMAMIVQTMVILFSLFMITSTFVTLDAITNKSKENTKTLKIYVEQLSQDFIHINRVYADKYLTSITYTGNPSQMLEDANVNTGVSDSFVNKYKNSGFKDISYTERDNVVNYQIQNPSQSAKYRLTIIVDKTNMTTELIFQRTYSDTVYFKCELRYEKPAGTEVYNVVIENWYYRE